MSERIPKIIHYCWFGNGKMPQLVLRCINSWKIHLPDYEIKLWNESNFNVFMLDYTREAYSHGKFAFVSDVCRVYILKEFGGIYLDSDVEFIKPLPVKLRTHYAFSGFEDNNSIPTGIIASEKNGKWVTEMFKYYADRHFIKNDGSLDLTTNVEIITNLMSGRIKLNNTFQEIDSMVAFYPSDVFCPKSHKTGVVKITDRTICIHHFAGSWQPTKQKFKSKIVKILINLVGSNNYNKVKNLFRVKI